MHTLPALAAKALKDLQHCNACLNDMYHLCWPQAYQPPSRPVTDLQRLQYEEQDRADAAAEDDASDAGSPNRT